MGRFDGKVAIVTGSTSGIGRATAILLAKEGAKVTITGLPHETANAAEVKAECAKHGVPESNLIDVLGDIKDTAIQDKVIEDTIAAFGKLDILVNNHGGGGRQKNEDGSWIMENFDAIMNLNCTSIMSLCTKAIPHLKETHGDIINVSSVSAVTASKNVPFYSISKGALDHVTRLLAFDLAPHGVRVNSINPGAVDTHVLQRAGLSSEQEAQILEYTAKTSIPMGRPATPEEIAQPILFMADRKMSGYITGQNLVVDGGATLQVAMASFDVNDMLKK
ncbi:3-oxoacyl-[acyl-carrier-protein] reductase FabG [Toxocara canis]|uniref:3-oxoacyl-[acyl-carrier-protein] reductase FabG n=1 Tax=Toxocara canis TaxID=6265 RepID=A0A0B2VB19_TOXCA|nr:3-oxoacyl-[acyl-carrier-protein] reductase FabG [Toxocara canis]